MSDQDQDNGVLRIDIDHTKSGNKDFVEYDFGGNLSSLVDICSVGEADGREIVYSNAVRQMKVSLRQPLKPLVGEGKPHAEVQAKADAWVPGLARASKSALDRAFDDAANLQGDEFNAHLKALKELQKSRAAGVGA